ncbi:MAG: putative Ig domain-containing protein [Acidobacteria bacterium]|nr:putative Ig domain-containing protein [Acidobacteriota bacterium]
MSTSQTLAVTGGVPPYRFALVGGRLPPGLFLDGASGLLAGTPIASGTEAFRVQASDSSEPPLTQPRDFTLGVAQGTPPELALSTSSAAGTFAAAIEMGQPPEPLSRVTVLLSFDAGVLSNPRVSPGAAAGETPVSAAPLAAGLLRLSLTGPPSLTRAGTLARLEFDAATAVPDEAVTILSTELVSEEGGC